MGKASSRKNQRRQGTAPSRQQFEARRAIEVVARGLQGISETIGKQENRRAEAARAWQADPPPAEILSWPPDSAGARFFDVHDMPAYEAAPRLATAAIPDARTFNAEPAHWIIAIHALIRAVILDGVAVTDPVVQHVLGLLGPAVDAEIAWAETGEASGVWPVEDFAEVYGPIFNLGAVALTDATWSALGEGPLREVLDFVAPRLDPVVQGLDLDGMKLAEALVWAASEHYVMDEDPADAATLEQIGGNRSGDPLELLLNDKVIKPADVLPLGLATLAVLADLCRTDAASVIQLLPTQSTSIFHNVRRLTRPRT